MVSICKCEIGELMARQTAYEAEQSNLDHYSEILHFVQNDTWEKEEQQIVILSVATQMSS